MDPQYGIPVDGRVLLELLLGEVARGQELALVPGRTAVTAIFTIINSSQRVVFIDPPFRLVISLRACLSTLGKRKNKS